MMSLVTQEFEVRQHTMIDLETLSTTSEAVVMQIGICRFDLLNPAKKLKTMKWDLDWYSQMDLNRVIDQSTVVWWSKQSDEARASVFKDGGEDVEKALSELTHFLGPSILWANPSNFDISILASLYRSFDLKVPWFHRDVVCLRSICTAAGYDRKNGPRSELPHDAESDAAVQARQAQEAWALLRSRS